jgi:hypothetical protein
MTAKLKWLRISNECTAEAIRRREISVPITDADKARAIVSANRVEEFLKTSRRGRPVRKAFPLRQYLCDQLTAWKQAQEAGA